MVALTFSFVNGSQNKVLSEPSLSVKKLINENNLEVVGYDHVNKLIESKSKNAMIIDARPEKKYLISHIPTAVSIPVSNFDKHLKKLYGIDKNKELITYCGGYNCNKSPKLAIKLKKLGFTNVKLYLAGMPEWSSKNYVVAETAAVFALYKKNKALLMDARPYSKFIGETIPGSLSIPDTKAKELAGRFPIDLNTQIVTFCGGYSCDKSFNLAKLLVSKGYKNVKVYSAGMPAWKKANYHTTKRKISPKSPMIKKELVFKNSIALGADEGSVDGEWFKSNIGKLPKNVQIVDVRPKSDFEVGHIDGAINIYSESMKMDEFYKLLPKDKTLVFSCATGGRALEAWMRLNNSKLDSSKIYYFDANINCKGSECKIEANEPLD
jgi:rhodanese-related sulfurtransferase